MSEIKVKTIEPSTGTNLTLGTSGDTVAVSSDAVKLDIWKDSGGNTLFQSDGAGTLSNVNSTLSGAGPKLILSQTAAASSTIDFTANIDSTYDKYMFVFVTIRPNTDGAELRFQCSTDGGSNYNTTMTTTFFDAYHQESGGLSGLAYYASFDQAQGTAYQDLCFNQGSDADQCLGGILNLFGPSSTTYVKQFYATTNFAHQSEETDNSFIAGYFNTTSAINAISFKMSTGTFEGKIKMYGVT